MENSTHNSVLEVSNYSRFSDLLKYNNEEVQETTGAIAQYAHDEQTVDNDPTGKNSVFDVASYILFTLGTCSTMKLHKLLYYCQAWSLVWDETPLFTEQIEAWANGPVVRELFNYHRGLFSLSFEDFSIGNYTKLTDCQKETIDMVLKFYGDKSPQWLIDQTHSESPWIKARKGLAPMERGRSVISLADMQLYYSSL